MIKYTGLKQREEWFVASATKQIKQEGKMVNEFWYVIISLLFAFFIGLELGMHFGINRMINFYSKTTNGKGAKK